MRITQKHLEAKAALVASLTGQDVHIYGAYGGWDVHVPSGEHGGQRSLMGGCGPAKEAAQFLDGMLAGIHMVTEDE